MTFRTFTLADLCLSPLNVRTNMEDGDATAALEASIPALGLLFPLVVHPFASAPKLKRLPGEPAHAYGTLAGGRRLRAIRKLVAAGTLPPEWPIDCVIRDVDPARITELSLAENLLRRDLRPYEVHAAIAKAAAQGASHEEIAANIGQRREWVERQLRLGNLTPEIFTAYAAGQLDADQAQAYAATADQALQRAAFKHFGGVREAQWRNQHEIRRWLRVGDHELQKLLRFVGLEAYRTAGGAFELDLFYDGPEERGRVVDEGILRELAETRLEELREDLRAEMERPDLRFIAAKPDMSLWYEPGAGPTPEAVAAHLDIETTGIATVSWWWESKKARAAYERGIDGSDEPAQRRSGVSKLPQPALGEGSAFIGHSDATTSAQAARAALKDEHGLTADGIHVMRSLRRELLRALLLDDAARGGEMGRDYLVWAQLRHEFTRDRSATIGARGLANDWQIAEERGPSEFIAPFLRETGAHQVWEHTLATVAAWPCFSNSDPAIGLEEFLASDEADKRLAGAVAAGLSLERSLNADGWRIAAHDVLADRTGPTAADLRALWSPTPAFMGLFPKLKRLEHARPFIGTKILAEWAKKDDKTIAGATAAAFDPKGHSDPAIAKAAGEWVHELLDFRDPALLSTIFEREPAPEMEPAL